MERTNEHTVVPAQAPPLAIPDAESARRVVARWLRTNIGDALYPAEPKFVEESFAWDVPVWFSTPKKPMAALVADIYVNATTGALIGRPSQEDLAERLRRLTADGE